MYDLPLNLALLWFCYLVLIELASYSELTQLFSSHYYSNTVFFFSLNTDLEIFSNSDTHLTLSPSRKDFGSFWFTQSASTTSLTCFILSPFIFRSKVVICIRNAGSYLHWFEELLRPFKASQCYSLIYKTTHYLSHFKAMTQRQGYYL